MKRGKHYNKFLSYTVAFFIFPALAGFVTGAVVFLFKLLTETVMEKSAEIYGFVAENLAYLPLLIMGAAFLGIMSRLFYKLSHLSSGGGIPAALATLRGFLPFKWIRTLICVFFSSICTYLSGVPLDTEGPAVQIGTCIGRGFTRTAPESFKGADRYIMTGGACAGIAVATGAPISGIFFALEDTHRRFTPTVFISAAVGVVCGSLSSSVLERMCGVSFSHFIIPKQERLELGHIWIVLLIALLAVAINTAILFVYGKMTSVKARMEGKLPPWVSNSAFVGLFVLVAICGVFFHDSIGSGHHLTDEVMIGARTWYMILIAILLRGILVSYASSANATGGIFVPLIAFGAMTGALCAQILISVGAIGAEYYGSLVVIGIGAFLSVAHKTPVTAILFTVEMFGGIVNAPYLVAVVAATYILSELLSEESINDAIMVNTVEKLQKPDEKEIIDVNLTVQPGAFVIGHETRDILWPANCRVLNIRTDPNAHHAHGIKEGDVVHLHFLTYDFERTAKELRALLGDQPVPRTYSADHGK